jgi:two-component system response regulator RegX3
MMTFLLRREDHVVLSITDPEHAYRHLESREVDLVLLETAHPRHDGYRLCKEFLNMQPHLALMIVSERSDEDEVVRGLLAGADDYITKPYSPRLLLARVQAVLRRARSIQRRSPSLETITAGPIALSAEQTQVRVNGVTVNLTPTELRLLQVFVSNARRVLTRGQLMTLAWGTGFVGTPKTVDVTVQRLRRKLEMHLPVGGPGIRTVRGFGYRLEAPSSVRTG